MMHSERLLGFLSDIRRYDWILVAAMVLLSAISLSAIYSIDLSRGTDLPLFFRQIVSIGIGFIVFFGAGAIHITAYRATARWWYMGALCILCAVLLFGTTVRGTRGWFQVAGFSLQPVEFVKVALVVFLAFLLQRHGRQFYRWQFVLGTGFSTVVLVALVLLQPDTGSAMLLMGTWFGVLCLSNTKKRYIFGLVGLAIAALLLGWLFVFKDYQKDRIMTFLRPELASVGSGYNLDQSMIAIGSGRLTGRGLGFGSQSQLHFLPEAQTDFIFAALGEELGFIGAGAVLTLFGVLLWRLLVAAKRAPDDFQAYIALGAATLLLLQLSVNIGGILRLLPLTGVTLPLVSYGGSSFIATCLLLGIVESSIRSTRASVYS